MDVLLREFRYHLGILLKAASGIPDAGITAAGNIAGKLDRNNTEYRNASQPNSLEDVLEKLSLKNAATDPDCAQLLSSLMAMSHALPWYKRPAPEMPDFEQGHMNAEIIGPKGLEVRNDILVGVTLMRPGLTYPDHHHPPEEVYIVLSDGLWRQNQDPWWSPGIGGYVYNPPDILHAMRSEASPLCAIWCLNLETMGSDFSLASE